MDFLFIIKASLLIAIVTYVYGVVLIDAGQPLAWWYKLLDRTIGASRGKDKSQQSAPIMILWKPLIGCITCIGGQAALWSYLLYCFLLKFHDYNPIEHFGIVMTTIFIIDVTIEIWDQITKGQP